MRSFNFTLSNSGVVEAEVKKVIKAGANSAFNRSMPPKNSDDFLLQENGKDDNRSSASMSESLNLLAASDILDGTDDSVLPMDIDGIAANEQMMRSGDKSIVKSNLSTAKPNTPMRKAKSANEGGNTVVAKRPVGQSTSIVPHNSQFSTPQPKRAAPKNLIKKKPLYTVPFSRISRDELLGMIEDVILSLLFQLNEGTADGPITLGLLHSSDVMHADLVLENWLEVLILKHGFHEFHNDVGNVGDSQGNDSGQRPNGSTKPSSMDTSSFLDTSVEIQQERIVRKQSGMDEWIWWRLVGSANENFSIDLPPTISRTTPYIEAALKDFTIHCDDLCGSAEDDSSDDGSEAEDDSQTGKSDSQSLGKKDKEESAKKRDGMIAKLLGANDPSPAYLGKKKKSKTGRRVCPTEKRSAITLSGGNPTTNLLRVARIVAVLNVVHEMLTQTRVATQREIFYRLKTDNLEYGLFTNQIQLNKTLEDIVLLLRVPRSCLGVMTQDKGLVTGAEMIINNLMNPDLPGTNVTKLHARGFPITEDLITKTKLDFGPRVTAVLVVEKETIFFTLLDAEIHSKYDLILVTAKGYPDVLTRRFLPKLHEMYPNIPFLYLGDGDPHGLDIFCKYKKHIDCLKWIGVHVNDMLTEQTFGNSPAAMTLTPRDRKLLRNMIVCEEIVSKNQKLLEEVQRMLFHGKKWEIEALYEQNVPLALEDESLVLDEDSNMLIRRENRNYLLDIYIPYKLKNGSSWM